MTAGEGGTSCRGPDYFVISAGKSLGLVRDAHQCIRLLLPTPRLVSYLAFGLLSCEISLILVFLGAGFLELSPPDTFRPSSCKAARQTCLVEWSRCFNPSLRTSRATFFILPRMFLKPYAAAFFAVTWKLPPKTHLRISKPSSCIQERL